MLESSSVVLPLTLASTLIASAIAKLRHPDDLRGWEELGVPAVTGTDAIEQFVADIRASLEEVRATV